MTHAVLEGANCRAGRSSVKVEQPSMRSWRSMYKRNQTNLKAARCLSKLMLGIAEGRRLVRLVTMVQPLILIFGASLTVTAAHV